MAAGDGPLAGILVVDFSRVLAGPFATMMLADLGARVIKIERPGDGDDSRAFGPFVDGRSMYFARVNRGKQSVVLDLAHPHDRTLAVRMCGRADVVLENFRPGVMDRLGLGYETLAAANPRLVYASVSGFGQTGPWRERPAYDSVVQGASGLMSITGTPETGPTKPGTSIADLSAGLYAFGAVCAALTGRDRTGRGSRVDVAMYDAALSLLEGAALSYLATGTAPAPIGNAHYSIAPFDTYPCADRPIVICAANDRLFARLADVLERPDLLTEPAFAANAGRVAARPALTAELSRTLRTRPAADWLDALHAAGVPAGPVSDVAEAVSSEQAAARRMVVRAGGLPVPGNPLKIGGAGGMPDLDELPAAPELDADGPALRAEFADPATTPGDAADQHTGMSGTG